MLIDIVYGDDWSAVFVDDEIFTQDHSIRDDRWAELVEKAFYRSLTSSATSPRIDIRWWEIEYGWLEDRDQFPTLFSEIPEHILERTQ